MNSHVAYYIIVIIVIIIMFIVIIIITIIIIFFLTCAIRKFIVYLRFLLIYHTNFTHQLTLLTFNLQCNLYIIPIYFM